MTYPTVNPIFAVPSATIPTLPALSLSEDEARTASWLATRLFDQRPYIELRGLYYDGLQKMQDLGISIPPSLVGLRTVIGWPQLGVDALDERLTIEGFLYPGATEVDGGLDAIWQANNLDGESVLAHLDALIYGRCYLVAGVGDDSTGGLPLITAESPMNMTAIWDARMRKCTAALQIYLDTDYTSDLYGQEVAALYLPDKTIYMGRAAPGGQPQRGNLAPWEITDRDDHGLGIVPVVRMANRQRLGNRDGLSEITPAWMNTVDSTCRTLLGMEVGREFHAAPRRYVIGASEDAFVKNDGSPVSAWDTYMGKIWGLERDEEGQAPTVGEFKTGDPKVYTELLDAYAQIFSGLCALPAEYLGLKTNGNPTSADAIRAQEARLVKRVERKQVAFSEAWEEVLRVALTIRGGDLPDTARQIETSWLPAATPTPAAASDAISKQISVGAVPATSDVTLSRLGYSAVERRRLAKDRTERDPAQQFVREAASLVEGKDVVAVQRIDKAVDNAEQPDPTGGAPSNG